jgi:single-strand DNA-binding protein
MMQQTYTNTEWHNVVVWRSLVEMAGKYLKKGSSIYLEGKIKTRNYEDKEGMKKYVTEIIAENLIMLDKAESKPGDISEISESFDKNEGNFRV